MGTGTSTCPRFPASGHDHPVAVLDRLGGVDGDIFDRAVVVDLPQVAADLGEGRARAIALEADRIAGRIAVAVEIEDLVAIGLALGEDEDVEAAAARELVGARAAVDPVDAEAAVQLVDAGVALQLVVAGAAIELVIVGAAVDQVVAAIAVEEVVAAIAGDDVVPRLCGVGGRGAAIDDVAALGAVEDVAIRAAGDHVIAAIAVDDVAAALAEQLIRRVGRIVNAVAAADQIGAAAATDDVGAEAAEQDVAFRAAVISMVGVIADDELAMPVGDRDVDVELGDAAFIVIDAHPDDVAGILLVIEQQPVLDGDRAGGGVDVEAAAGVVHQAVGEGGAVRVDRGQRADQSAVIGDLLHAQRAGDAGRRNVAGEDG